MPRADEWSDDEIVLALATCPRERQSYSPRHKNVIDLADLIGRTPGAVSLHFANISNLIHGGEHGKTHVGARTRELFRRYQGRDDELQARAAEIRARYLAKDPTPRIEKKVTREQGTQLTLDVFTQADQAGLPKDSVKTYERQGSWYFGVILQLSISLFQYREQVSEFLRWLSDKLGQDSARSKGYDLALHGEWERLAEDMIAEELPQFHPEHLSPTDRVTLALRLERGGSLRGWKPTRTRLRLLANMNQDAERKRVSEYLGIDGTNLCDMCLLMLVNVVERALKKGARSRQKTQLVTQRPATG